MMAVNMQITEIGQDAKDLLIAQYGALRSEIHQRVDQRQQLLTYALIGAASFFGIGLQSWVSSVTVLCYPLLAFFLACAWSQHNTRIGQITIFLREIEDKSLSQFGLGWESYRRATFIKKRFSLASSVSFSARGLFAGSELLALIIGLARFSQDAQMVVVFVLLAVVDVVVIAATMLVLEHRRSRGLLPQSPIVTEQLELVSVTIEKEEANG
jgi:hypothetical protein